MRLRRVLFHASLLLLLLLLPLRSTLPTGTRWNAAALLARDHSYNWLAWLPSALGAKLGQALWGLRPFLDETAASQFLRDYVAEARGLQALEAQIETLFSDAAESDPLSASAGLRSQRDAIRQHLRERQGLAEGVLEGQLAALLVDQGFAVAGHVLPPVAMRLTALPQVLVVSPRNEIRYEISIGLEPLPLDQAVALEGQIEERLDASALVTPIGGIALYPAMILESASIADPGRHLRPNGCTITFSPSRWARPGTMTARRASSTRRSPASLRRKSRPCCCGVTTRNWRRRLRVASESPSRTREASTSARRWTARGVGWTSCWNAARSRRPKTGWKDSGNVSWPTAMLSVAEPGPWFAFYGGYQSAAQGPGGDDPVGPALRELRARSDSLHDWVVSLRGITTTEHLLGLLEERRQSQA